MAKKAKSDRGKKPVPAAAKAEPPGRIDAIVRALLVVCAGLLVVDYFVHKHSPFAIEHAFGFYAWFTAAACVVLVLLVKLLRPLLMRPENFYDR